MLLLLWFIVPAQAGVPPLTTWYWQLQGTVNTTRVSKVYDIDYVDNTAATIQQLKSAGHVVICYFSAGTWENWRPDASQFPDAVKGASNGWPGENWLDIRSSVVRTLMAKRMDVAKAKGCDGLEPDNVDGYSNNTGFPLTKADQINYNSYLASAAHQRGMLVALKNATDLASKLVGNFDFAIVEECQRYKECPQYSAFITNGKAVLEAEYPSKTQLANSTYLANACAQAKTLKFSLAFFAKSLDGRRFQVCP